MFIVFFLLPFVSNQNNLKKPQNKKHLWQQCKRLYDYFFVVTDCNCFFFSTNNSIAFQQIFTKHLINTHVYSFRKCFPQRKPNKARFLEHNTHTHTHPITRRRILKTVNFKVGYSGNRLKCGLAHLSDKATLMNETSLVCWNSSKISLRATGSLAKKKT